MTRWSYDFQGSDQTHPHMFNNADAYDADSLPVKDWCFEQFGFAGTRWMSVGAYFWFKEDNDAFAFRMRWC